MKKKSRVVAAVGWGKKNSTEEIEKKKSLRYLSELFTALVW
jgi:hypothetical protein